MAAAHYAPRQKTVFHLLAGTAEGAVVLVQARVVVASPAGRRRHRLRMKGMRAQMCIKTTTTVVVVAATAAVTAMT